MRDDLVPVEVEIDPPGRAPPLRTAEQLAVKPARGREIVDRKGEMKRRQAHAVHLLGTGSIVETFVDRV
jgi:hypothetical protein